MGAIKKFFKKHFKQYNPRCKKLQDEGANTMRLFSEVMEQEGIDWWLEFGTLLGMYRDNDFIKGDIDIDFGANLYDAPKITEALCKAGCKLWREYHVLGDLAMEQTFKAPNGLGFDIFYLCPRGDKMVGSGFRRFQTGPRRRPSFYKVHDYTFVPFTTIEVEFKGVKVRIPANAEEHIIEVYGPGYKTYDPLFKDAFNKTKYPISQKVGIGFRKGLRHLK